MEVGRAIRDRLIEQDPGEPDDWSILDAGVIVSFVLELAEVD